MKKKIMALLLISTFLLNPVYAKASNSNELGLNNTKSISREVKDINGFEKIKEIVNIKNKASTDCKNLPINKPNNIIGEDFIKILGHRARELGQKYNIYASVMIAQAILESGMGGSGLSQEPNNNLFGIKGSYEGQTQSFNTQEEYSGSKVNIVDNFRIYPSLAESMEDYANLIVNGVEYDKDYYSGALKSNAATYMDATKFLTGKYATDSGYSEKLNDIIEKYNLTKYDNPLYAKIDESKKYTLESVANSNGIDLDILKSLNPNIKDEKAYLEKGDKISISPDYIYEQFQSPAEHNYLIINEFKVEKEESGEYIYNNGMEILLMNNSKIKTSSDGEVVETGENDDFGKYIVIKHEGDFYSYYFFLDSINVKLGDKIDSNTVIGMINDTIGSHLYFSMSTELWNNYFNPRLLIDFEKEIIL